MPGRLPTASRSEPQMTCASRRRQRHLGSHARHRGADRARRSSRSSRSSPASSASSWWCSSRSSSPRASGRSSPTLQPPAHPDARRHPDRVHRACSRSSRSWCCSWCSRSSARRRRSPPTFPTYQKDFLNWFTGVEKQFHFNVDVAKQVSTRHRRDAATSSSPSAGRSSASSSTSSSCSSSVSSGW